MGAGNHSASLTKQWFPLCRYYGIDRTRDYDNNDNDFNLMEAFYELDLTRLEFDLISDDFFDVIMMSHIIEHLQNGDAVIECLVTKLKRGGVIYIEYPSARSTKFPSMKGGLNFYDDPTHCRIYTLDEIESLLLEKGFKILSAGTRRDWVRIVLLPLLMASSKIKLGYVTGSVFWDMLGFAEYVFAEKQ
ncbi:MAG: methyltransferase domain-containing protein [Candidatus Kryptoniota bacterium]